MQLSDIRSLTPITQEYAYFQSSGFSPKMEPVIEETNRWAQFHNAGGAAPGINEKMLAGFEATRDKVAQSMNADSDEIVLGENTTIGINIVANGINWQAGDNVILSDKEHPGNRITWYSHVQRYGIELRFLEVVHDEEQMLAQFERLLDERTGVVSISHVCRRTGQRLPARALVDIAHDRGVPVLLDGAQAYGAVPVDMRELDCDFYAFSGHKYIMAPQGTGGFYVRRDRIPWIQPSWIGSHSQKDFDLVGGLTLLDEAKRFEFGTRNLADQLGFGKALDFWAEIGYELNAVRLAQGAFTTRLARLNLAAVFSRTLSWVNLIQYDNVTETAGINSRLHWTPEAGRDIYLVINHHLQDWDGDERFDSLASDAVVKVNYTLRF